MHRLACLLVFVALIALFAIVGCRPSCRQPEFARDARVTSEYLLVTSSADGRHEVRGIGPRVLTMSGFDAFRCDDQRADLPVFWVELGPHCKLPAHATSHRRDGGDWSSFEFIQAEGTLVAGRPCTLEVGDDRKISGTVESGIIVIRPTTTNVDLALQVPDGTLRLTASGVWEAS